MNRLTVIISVMIFLSCGGSEVKTVIMAYSGSVKINSSTIPGAGLMQLRQGDVIETGEKSFCDLMVNDKNIIRIRDNSRLVLHIKFRESLLQLDRGWITVVTKQKFVSKEKYRITAPAVSAEIRGRYFCVRVENGKSTYLCICNGTARINGEDKTSGKDSGSVHHDARRFVLGENETIATDMNPGLLYHNDFAIEQMARIIKE